MTIALFFSRARGAISEVVDLEKLADNYRTVAVTGVYDDFFLPTDQEHLLGRVRDDRVEAVVLAGNSLKHYEDSLGGAALLEEIEAAGVNFNKIACANLLEQVARPFAFDKRAAEERARAYVDIALHRVKTASETGKVDISPRQSILVLGASTAGLIASSRLLDLGFRVCIMDRREQAEPELEVEEILPTLGAVSRHPNARMLFGSDLLDFSGTCGDYEVTYSRNGREDSLFVGGVIVSIADADSDWMDEVRPMLQIDVDSEGRYRSKNPITLPVQTSAPAIAVVPPHVHEGALVRDKVSGADSAVLQVASFLLRREAHQHILISRVDESVCGGCGICVNTCFFKACSVDASTHHSSVDPRRCRGCGKCVAACPTGARDLLIDPTGHIVASIRRLAEVPVGGTKVLAFACNGCGYPALDKAGFLPGEGGEGRIPFGLLPLWIKCGGRLDSQFVLTAFSEGFDGVIVIRCHEDQCHNVVGNRDMDRRLNLLREVLRASGIDAERLRLLDTSVMEAARLAEDLDEAVRDIERIARGVKANV
ncbi:MAG: hydrogenase iron-sulfur subunit [Actinobacteria bacterium]|nr:MAG: hydrogenase iron-sulfur subunit [Actinomycetota bacterium]